MRERLFVCLIVLLFISTAWNGEAQTSDPALLRITFVSATSLPTPTPTVTPTIPPTDPTPTATPVIVPTVIPTEPPSAVPEPATFALFGLGAAVLAYIIRQARRRTRP